MKLTRMAMFCWLINMPWLCSGALAENAATTVAAKPGEAVEFHFSVKPGDTRRFRIATQTFGAMNMPPLPPQKFSQRFEQEFMLTCLRMGPDRTTVFEMTFPNIALQMNIGGVTVEVDTRKPSATSQPVFGAIERMFGAITKVKCQATFSPAGEPLKVDGLREGIDSVMAEAKDLMAIPAMKLLLDRMRTDYLGNNVIEENLRTSYRLFPDGGKANVGDRWNREWQVKLPVFKLGALGKAEYELLGTEQFHGRPCAKIRFKSAMNTLPKPKQMDGNAAGASRSQLDRMNLTMNASGGNGTAYVDYAQGAVVQLRETQRIAIEMSIESDSKVEQPEIRTGAGKMTQNLTTSIQMDLLDDAKTGEPNAVAPGGVKDKAETQPAGQ